MLLALWRRRALAGTRPQRRRGILSGRAGAQRQPSPVRKTRPLDCADRWGCVRCGVHQRTDKFHKRSMLGTGRSARKERGHLDARWLAAGRQVRLVLDVYASGRFSAQIPSVSIGALVQLTSFRLHASQTPRWGPTFRSARCRYKTSGNRSVGSAGGRARNRDEPGHHSGDGRSAFFFHVRPVSLSSASAERARSKKCCESAGAADRRLLAPMRLRRPTPRENLPSRAQRLKKWTAQTVPGSGSGTEAALCGLSLRPCLPRRTLP